MPISEADPPHLTEETLGSELAFDGRLLRVFRDRVRLPDGSESVREYVRHPGAVVVIADLGERRLLFERQYRYALRRTFFELPAGKIDPGEAIEVTARRELLEETGYTADHWRHLGTMHPCIGYSDERIEIFLARGLVRAAAPQLDHGELLETVHLDLDEAIAAVLDGRITDAKTVTALFWAERHL